MKSSLRQTLDEFRAILEEKEQAREELLKLTREMRINSTKAIASLHAKDFKKAEELLSKALEILDRIYEFKSKYPDIYYPITHDAMQELVEAYSFYHVLKHENLEIDFSKLKVEIPAILTGLADMAGEVRRFILDLLRKGEDFEKAEKMIGIMEEIYSNLLTFNFPDKLTPNLRPKVDYIRGAIERTKSDFIAAKVATLEKVFRKIG
jgi:translin